MSDFDDETLERELFAQRRLLPHAGAQAGARPVLGGGVEDVFARIDRAQRRSRRTRMFGFARIVSQAGTAFAAAAACLALVRGAPANTSDEIGRDETHLVKRAFSHASSGTASTNMTSEATSALACNAGDAPGVEAACEAPAVAASSVNAEAVETEISSSPMTTPPAPIACESHSCGGEVTCAGDGP